jgi:uncharacterized membrane protein (UPF0127 family)
MGPHAFAADDKPLQTMCVQIDNQRYTLEVADTPELQQKGLQHRTELKRGHGMVFTFPNAAVRTFWMKDCEIPLDIMFFNDGRMVGAADKAPPCHAEQCTMYRSPIPANTVVELKSGTRLRRKITVHSRLKPCNLGQELKP